MGLLKWWNFIKTANRLYAKGYTKKMLAAQGDSDELEEVRTKLRNTERKLGDVRTDLRKKEGRLERLRNRFLESNEHAEEWNARGGPDQVTYSRPIWDGSENENYSIPVEYFVQPNDHVIKNELDEAGLSIDDPLDCGDVIPEIYKLAKEDYRYRYDSSNLGRTEFWQFPFETRVNDGDCEDYAHVIASYLRAAGLPAFRVRVVAGGTLDDGYGGHATVYVLGDDMETWYHLNSTTPEFDRDRLQDYPVWGADIGVLNIDPEDVWLSFNDEMAWNDFPSSSSSGRAHSEMDEGFRKHLSFRDSP